MLHAFSINIVKLTARKKQQLLRPREYVKALLLIGLQSAETNGDSLVFILLSIQEKKVVSVSDLLLAS
jgi:hypothetical protein